MRGLYHVQCESLETGPSSKSKARHPGGTDALLNLTATAAWFRHKKEDWSQRAAQAVQPGADVPQILINPETLAGHGPDAKP